MADSGTKPFDLDGLNQLYGPETVVELLGMSVDEARGLLTQIDDGITLKESKGILAAAHQLKGLASTMTVDGLAAVSLELETAARQDNWQAMQDIQQRLQREFNSFADYVAGVLRQ